MAALGTVARQTFHTLTYTHEQLNSGIKQRRTGAENGKEAIRRAAGRSISGAGRKVQVEVGLLPGRARHQPINDFFAQTVQGQKCVWEGKGDEYGVC